MHACTHTHIHTDTYNKHTQTPIHTHTHPHTHTKHHAYTEITSHFLSRIHHKHAHTHTPTLSQTVDCTRIHSSLLKDPIQSIIQLPMSQLTAFGQYEVFLFRYF
uniref:Uncharacterized protein n=1 Tax=Octopus bimaculoides TaxID=37653 RepID=A0A0L8GBK9_OCTBM